MSLPEHYRVMADGYVPIKFDAKGFFAEACGVEAEPGTPETNTGDRSAQKYQRTVVLKKK